MEPLNQTAILEIRDASQTAVARRMATRFAEVAGLSEQRSSAAAVVAIELANNLLQHAGGGQLFLTFNSNLHSLEIAAVDHGRGMADVDRCLSDGFSTASTPGLGLGAIKRFATEFAAYSIPGRATVVSARMSREKSGPDFSVVCTAIHGETMSGDSWAVSEDGRSFMVVDGLGHGMFAADAARAATELFHRHGPLSPAALLELMHPAMRPTRGAATAIARVQRETRTIEFAGIGNISCQILGQARTQSMVSHNGTLGHQMRKVQQFSYSYQPSDLLLMQSDGLATHSKAGIPATLLEQPPFAIAPLLYSEQVRGRDDATLLVSRLD